MLYTLSHPKNDRDVTERAQIYTLQNASIVRQSRCSFLNAWENTSTTGENPFVVGSACAWIHGCSLYIIGWALYSLMCIDLLLEMLPCLLFLTPWIYYDSPSPGSDVAQAYLQNAALNLACQLKLHTSAHEHTKTKSFKLFCTRTTHCHLQHGNCQLKNKACAYKLRLHVQVTARRWQDRVFRE